MRKQKLLRIHGIVNNIYIYTVCLEKMTVTSKWFKTIC